MAGSILGNAVIRTEDPELLTGNGTYIDNMKLDGLLTLVFVRSPYAHALITAIDTTEAAAAPGVRAVLTNADLGVEAHHGFVKIGDQFARPPLAEGRVRFVGEPVVAIVAETRAAGTDASELVIIDYEPLEPVINAEAAFSADSPVLFDENGSNVAMNIVDPSGDDVFGDADHIVKGRFINQRVAAVPMEPNCALVDPNAEPLTMWAATQMPHVLRDSMMGILGLEADQIRVIAPHVGGGFGAKVGVYHEFTVVARAAQITGAPVKWVETRSEDMVALVHSRAQVQYAQVGVTNEGKLTGLRAHIVGDSGAYPNIGTMLSGGTRRMSQGVYDLAGVSVDVAVATTTTTPTGAYRGAGRPEAASMVERIVDMAAAEIGMDPIELRRKNFLTPDQFPLTTPTGAEYDCGDYEAPLDKAIEMAGYDNWRAEQKARRDSGDVRQIGIGVASFVEITAGGGSKDWASVAIETDGSATVYAGTSAHGQGHQTTFAMIVSDKLGIPVDKIRLVQSDTAIIPRGGGTGGSRSIQVGGSAVSNATNEVWDKTRKLAAHLLEANPDDIVVNDDGRVGVAGVPASALDWGDLAQQALDVGDDIFGDQGEDIGLRAQLDFDQGAATYPFGTHISIVDVDMDTGEVKMLQHVGVDDCGTVINPLLVAGQQHGGIAQGVAQALWEEVVFDEHGNPLTSNLADYAIPSAAELISYDVASTETPTPLNPLGAKGIGEASTIGSTPAIQNAVIDALAPLGVRHLDMPLSPQRVWGAIQDARNGSLAPVWHDPPAIFAELAAAAAAEATTGNDPTEDAPDV